VQMNMMVLHVCALCCVCMYANAPVCAAPEQHLMNGNLVKLSLLQALK